MIRLREATAVLAWMSRRQQWTDNCHDDDMKSFGSAMETSSNSLSDERNGCYCQVVRKCTSYRGVTEKQ
jgi:hypothetical protein